MAHACLDAAAALGIADDEAVRSRVLSYLAWCEKTQLSSVAEGEDPRSAERLRCAAAVFLALYDEPTAAAPQDTTPPGAGATGRGRSCRLGDLLRQCNTGVKDFMEHLTLLAGRLPEPLSAHLEGDLRVMKEGIVVTKMLHGKYRQIWNERSSLFPPAMFGTTAAGVDNKGDLRQAVAGKNGSTGSPPSSDVHAGGSSGGGGVGGTAATAATATSFAPPPAPTPSDPQALPRLGWYLYLLTKDVLGFRSSNAAFVHCLNLVLAALGAVVWNSSSPFPRGDSLPPSFPVFPGGGSDGAGPADSGAGAAAGGEAGCSRGEGEGGAGARAGASSPAAAAPAVAPGGGVGTYGGEAALLARLSASGRCPAKDVRAMSARVVEVIEALLQEGIVVSISSSSSSSSSYHGTGGVSPTGAAGAAGAAAAAAATAAAVGGSSSRGTDEGGGATAPRFVGIASSPGNGDGGGHPVAGAAPLPPQQQQQQQLAGRAERVAGVFHPSVAAENADRLDECYWARVSQRGGGRGGVLLDETFVLTPDLRDTVGTPRHGGGGCTPRRSTLTPSVSRTSRQLFQDYQRVSTDIAAPSAQGQGASAAAPSSRGGGDERSREGLALSFGPPGDSSNGPSAASTAAAAAAAAAAAVAAAGSYPGSILPALGGPVGNGMQNGGGMGTAGSGFGMLQNPLASPRSRMAAFEGVGGGGVIGKGARRGPPETPVMAVMETARWIEGLDAGTRAPPASLLRKLQRCAAFSAILLEDRLAGLMAKLDGPAAQQQQRQQQRLSSFGGGSSSDGRGAFGGHPRGEEGAEEASALGDAKRKAQALYYSTLEALLDTETERMCSEDHSRLLAQENLHKALLACCLEAVLKASSLLSLTFPWVLRRMEVDALDLCKVLESFARLCPSLPMNLKYHLFEVQTEIVERLALETGAGVFRLIGEHKAAGEWPVPPLRETDVAPPTGSRVAGLPCSPLKERSKNPRQPDPPRGNAHHQQEIAARDPAAAPGGEGGGGGGGGGEESERKAAAARARASTLDLFFRRLMKRAAEVVAELCLRRLRLPGDTADQVWTVVKRCVAQRIEMLKDRHLHHVVLCSTYSVCKVNSVTPEVTFKRIIEQYKQLAGAGGGLSGGVGTPRLSVIKDILLERGTEGRGGVAAAGKIAGVEQEGEPRQEKRGDIIKFYNQVYIPAMKQIVLEFKNLAGQQKGVASITTAQDAARVARRLQSKRSAASSALPPRDTGAADAGAPSSADGGGGGGGSGSGVGDGARRAHPNEEAAPAPAAHRRSQRRRLTRSGADAAGGAPSSSATEQGNREEQEGAEGREDESGQCGGEGSGPGGRGAAGGHAESKEGSGGGSGGGRGGRGGDSEDDVVAAGAALSALSTAPHPHKPLVSHLPSQKVTQPKRVQENVFLTTVSSPARPAGGSALSRSAVTDESGGEAVGRRGAGSGGGAGGGGFRGAGGRASGSGGGGSGDSVVGSDHGRGAKGGRGGAGVGGGGGMYAFGGGASQDLQVINRAVRAAASSGGDDEPPRPASAKRSKSSATRSPSCSSSVSSVSSSSGGSRPPSR